MLKKYENRKFKTQFAQFCIVINIHIYWFCGPLEIWIENDNCIQRYLIKMVSLTKGKLIIILYAESHVWFNQFSRCCIMYVISYFYCWWSFNQVQKGLITFDIVLLLYHINITLAPAVAVELLVALVALLAWLGRIKCKR